MINPLTLGNKTFPNNIIQGPLAGVSCAPFRALTWQYSQPAFTCTEMISCNTLIKQPAFALQRFIQKDPQEGPVCFQLSGSTPNEVAQATQRVTDAGADLIDLNCGCPVKKIRSKGAGSSLLHKPTQLYQLIRTLKANTHVPVSIKIRVDGHSDEKFNMEIANIVGDAGADFLIVHGRHWSENYDTPCHYQQIQFFVDNLKIPVIGNGDIKCVESLQKMFATGCAGVMISRAGVGQPWLIGNLIHAMNKLTFTLPSAIEIGAIYVSHVQGLIRLIGNEKHAILQARKIAKYYARGLSNKNEFCTAINACENFSDFQKICCQYFV